MQAQLRMRDKNGRLWDGINQLDALVENLPFARLWLTGVDSALAFKSPDEMMFIMVVEQDVLSFKLNWIIKSFTYLLIMYMITY